MTYQDGMPPGIRGAVIGWLGWPREIFQAYDDYRRPDEVCRVKGKLVGTYLVRGFVKGCLFLFLFFFLGVGLV